jgi:hypothetical protein
MKTTQTQAAVDKVFYDQSHLLPESLARHIDDPLYEPMALTSKPYLDCDGNPRVGLDFHAQPDEDDTVMGCRGLLYALAIEAFLTLVGLAAWWLWRLQ